jgi:hypothetical protein
LASSRIRARANDAETVQAIHWLAQKLEPTLPPEARLGRRAQNNFGRRHSLTESNARPAALDFADRTEATILGNSTGRRKIDIATRKRLVTSGCEMAPIKSRRTRNS